MLIYSNIVESRVDGPGVRAVMHTAGCNIGCPGCFNTHTHPVVGANVRNLTTQEILNEIQAVSPDFHLTISGGEPSDQLASIIPLLQAIRSRGGSTIMYSGRVLLALRKRRLWQQIESEHLLDVLIDGPFKKEQAETQKMAGSENQKIHLLTPRFSEIDFLQRDTEVTVNADGSLTILGFPSAEFIAMLGL